jgi:ABC-2 type transport system ATP-binding protein
MTDDTLPAASRVARERGPDVAPLIRVRRLWHRFGQVDVLRDVSFDVMPGDIFGFIGPNGAGKTTTIRILATLLEPLAGKVEVAGVDVTLDPARVRRAIGYMPDHAGIYERVSVREYLEFFADAYGVARETGSDRRATGNLANASSSTYAVVDAALELTDLRKLEDKLVETMSKGQKQRLQLARTLLHDPQVLIMDEPASDLDPRARIELRDLLVELRRMGKTIFLSSHILTELADICTSVAILERGHIVATGPIHEIARVRNASAPAPDAPGAAPPVAVHAVKLKVLAAYEDAADTLRPLPFVTAIEPAGGALSVRYTGDETAIARMVRALVEAGIDVVRVEPERNELERIFLEVTRGDGP